MEYISIKNGINQTTNIHKNAFIDLVNLTIKKSKDFKIKGDPEIKIVRSGKNIKISLDFTVSEKANLNLVLTNIKKNLTDAIINSFDIKPYNILMNYQGRH